MKSPANHKIRRTLLMLLPRGGNQVLPLKNPVFIVGFYLLAIGRRISCRVGSLQL